MHPAAMRYTGVLRYQPTELVESLASPAMQYVYVDSTTSNGFYPDTQTFMSSFEHANSSLLNGACAAIAKLSDVVLEQTMPDGSSAPTVVIAAYPVAVGSCTQSLDLGTSGSTHFSVVIGS